MASLIKIHIAASIAHTVGTAIGYFLSRSIVKNQSVLAPTKDLLKLLILGGPAAFILPAAITTLSIALIGGFLPTQHIIGNSITWWFSTSLGVFVFTPITLICLNYKESTLTGKKLTAVISIVIPMLISCFAYFYLAQRDIYLVNEKMRSEAVHYQKQIQKILQSSTNISGYIANRISQEQLITEEVFTQAAEQIILQRKDVTAIQWIQKVLPNELEDFEKFINQQQNTSFSLRNAAKPVEEAKPQIEHFPVTYLLPMWAKAAIQGIDLASDLKRYQLLVKSRESGEAVITVTPILVATEFDYSAMFSYMPVYATDKPIKTAQQRSAAHLGFVATIYNLEDVINEQLSNLFLPDITIRIYDQTQPLERPIFQTGETALFHNGFLKATELPLDLPKLQWKLVLTPTQNYLYTNHSWNNWYVFIAGILFTTLMGLMAISAITKQTDIEKQVALRSKELLEAQDQLKLLATAFESHDAIVINNTNSITLQVNKAMIETSGFSAEELIGRDSSELVVSPSPAEFKKLVGQQLAKTGHFDGESINIRKNGETYPARVKATVIYDEQGNMTHIVSAFSDITEEKEAEQKIHQLAFYDALTSLPNRRLVIDRIEHELSTAKRHDHHGAILFIDIDNFKTINDTLGHDHGDQLLMAISRRLVSQVREVDTVSRLGGDEFILLLQGEPCSEEQAINNASSVVQKILSLGDNAYNIGTHKHFVTLSVGATIFPSNAADHQELLKQADTALYRAKALGKNTCCFFHKDMQLLAEHHVALENDLREALGNDQFLLCYQPQVDQQGTVLGIEALLRWQHPERGMVSPSEFIPIAEDSDLIIPIGDWVIRESCKQIRQLLDEGIEISHVSVNVSERQFRQKDFVTRVADILRDYKLPAKYLMLELTEGLVVTDIVHTQKVMDSFSAMGVQLSMDDFGTGYSSLSYLSTLPFDELKIDQSFIRNLFLDERNTAIVTTIISMAENLKLMVLAEGVEKKEQLDYLK